MAAALGVLVSCGSVKSGEEVVAASRDSKVVVAYVTSWSEVMPDPQYMTHINYAFGHVNESFNGVKIDNEERLRQIVDLRKQKPELKVLLSIGGWGSGRFSEMAANDEYRRAFAADCDRVVKEFALDGIDIDWEYPTSSMANISSSPDDTENFTLLMQDIRAAIGNEKELTLATVASARYIDFKAILPSVDFVNIMAYDMASAPKHHSALYPSGHSGDITSDGAVTAHLKAGVPPSKLVMGMPFYGRGGDGYPMWQWFSDFMGGVRFKNYIAPLADGTLIVEDKQHPVMKDVLASFVVPDDEWYTYDKSPRPNVHVLANVDESSYTPASDIKMGDHPVVWVNESKKARNVYFQIGHSSKLYETEGFTTMFRNAINWTLER